MLVEADVRQGSTVILTYNEIDGACAAAMVLLANPGAEVVPSSAGYIGRSIEKLLERSTPPVHLHICGVGIYCDIASVTGALAELAQGGTEIVWYSGKGHLKGLKKHLAPSCTLAFHDKLGSNTAAVRQQLTLPASKQADQLEAVLAFYPSPIKAKGGVAKLIRLVDAALARYFKYQDYESYPAVIPKLAGQVPLTPEDDEMIAHYRKFRYRHALTGRSKAIKEACRAIGSIAPFDTTNVIIYGETGVGKEHAAHLIHEGSKRSGKPMHAINCGTFIGEEQLLNSRLFGHVKGAFTGAIKDRVGVFELATDSTLFLDEIGELSLTAQVRLLRVIQEGVLNRSGDDSKPIKVYTRVVAATNRDLLAMVREGTFREDLYYRLNIVPITIPPLRERLADIGELAPSLLERLEEELDLSIAKLTDRQFDALQGYSWPGNVRQLGSLLHRVAALSKGRMTGLETAVEKERQLHAAANLNPRGGPSQTLDLQGEEAAQPAQAQGPVLLPLSIPTVKHTGKVLLLDKVKQNYAVHVLALCNNNLTEASRRLGISKNTLKKLIGR